MARTNIEIKGLSRLMRDKCLTRDNIENAITISTSRDKNGKRKPQTLEITKGDMLRIGATVWHKQLFNGTIITVDDIKTAYAAAGNGEDRVHIRGTTEQGRKVSFFTDQIKDWYGNIRLDYGYALTISSSQGATARVRSGRSRFACH